jgi:hypothetical protein
MLEFSKLQTTSDYLQEFFVSYLNKWRLELIEPHLELATSEIPRFTLSQRHLARHNCSFKTTNFIQDSNSHLPPASTTLAERLQ